MKIVVLGHTGMLGRYVYNQLSKNHNVIGLNRETLDASEANPTILNSIFFKKDITEDDVIINCMGTIKPMVDKYGPLNAIKVNSLFPHNLANVCEEKGVKLIHITTDCVFSGKDGQYTEESPHDCLDVYGKSKSLGEPSNCTVLRTSIIGEEFDTSRSLIEWVKSENGKTVNGFLNHQWNGLTCHQTSKVLEKIIDENLYWKGVRHIYSSESLNKYELVKSIVEAHELDINVNPADASTKCDRTLSTSIYDEDSLIPFSLKFEIPDIPTQLKYQYENPPNRFQDEN